MVRILRRALFPALILFLGMGASAEAKREIVDMAGRKVIVPDTIRRVYCTVPPATFMIYAVDPGLLAGLNSPIPQEGKKYLDRRVQILPVVGGWMGQGKTPNLETLLKIRPDIVVAWRWKGAASDIKLRQTLEQLGLPLVYITIDSVNDYPEAFRFLGRLLDRQTRTGKLSRYAQKTLDDLKRMHAALPDSEKVTVYYAEGADGLNTECSDSVHAELIPLSGGKNIYRCETKTIYGMEKISLEEVLNRNPDVILARDRAFMDRVLQDRRWAHVRAVQNRRIYRAPLVPIDWFDRPPTFMRLLGARWLTNTLYPARFPFNRIRETRDFYRLFLNVSLSEQAAREILSP